MKPFKFITLVFLFSSVFSINAQQKLEKISKSIKANKDVTINLNTSYTNIEIETWNKSAIAIEAFIESSELGKEELQEFLDTWDVTVEGSGNDVSITTKGDVNYAFNFNFNFAEGEAHDALRELEFNLADLPEMPEMNFEMPEMNFEIPEIPEMPELPELPELPEGIHRVHFDIDKYKAEGEPYLEKWSKEYEKKYGKDYQEKMKAWAKEFSKTDFDKYSKEMEAWGEKFGKSFGKDMQVWGEKFGKDYELKMEAWSKKFDDKFGPEWEAKMEKWGEEYGKQMEAYGKAFEKRAGEREAVLDKRLEARSKQIEKRSKVRNERMAKLEKRLSGLKDNKVIKTIKIKIPKDAKLKVNVRHGELKFTSVNNLKADLSHSTLLAESIDGSNTSINASYTPVLVTNWNAGELKLNYVDNAILKNVKHLMLTSNSSNITVGELSGNAIINGSFGDLEIDSITNSFNNLNLILENSDVVVSLPKTDYNLQYQGKRTRFEHPDKKTKENISTFSSGNLNSSKTIVINAKYSNVVMQ
jgi:hypothetical protein